MPISFCTFQFCFKFCGLNLKKMNSWVVIAFALLAALHLACCRHEYDVNGPVRGGSHYRPDLVAAASGHSGHGRVQIKVYRGPSEGHEHFAPHGYWVKQPADHYH